MIVEFSIVPIGRGEELAGLVARVIDVVDRSGLPYQLTSMGTIVEGNWDEGMGLIKDCHRTMRRQASRVLTRISIDDRQGPARRMRRKVEAVEKVLGRSLRK